MADEQLPLSSRHHLVKAWERVGSLESALDHLQDRLGQMELTMAHLLRLRDEVAQLQSALPHLQEQHAEALRLAEELTRQRRADFSQLHQGLAELERQTQGLEVRMRHLEDRLQLQDAHLQEARESVSHLGEEVAHLRDQMEDLRRHLQQQARIAGGLAEQVHKVASSLEALEGLREATRKAVSQHDQLAQRMASLEGSIGQVTLDMQELARHLTVAMERAQEALNRLAIFQREVDEMARQLQQRMEGLLQLLHRQKRRQMDIVAQEVKELSGDLDKTP
jgi:chromosome segregation ATPase